MLLLLLPFAGVSINISDIGVVFIDGDGANDDVDVVAAGDDVVADITNVDVTIDGCDDEGQDVADADVVVTADVDVDAIVIFADVTDTDVTDVDACVIIANDDY